MTLSNFYNAPVKATSNDVKYLEKHLDNIYIELSDIPYDYENDENNQKRVFIKSHLYDSYDYRRSMHIFSVWFDDKPIMLCMEAGRELRDDVKTFISDQDGFINMIKYLRTLIKDEINFIYSVNEELSELEVFYSHDLCDDFDFPAYNPTFNVGDKVIVKNLTLRNQLLENVSALIKEVKPKSFFKCYLLQLLDYKLYPIENTRDYKIVSSTDKQFDFYKDKEMPFLEVKFYCPLNQENELVLE